VLHERVVVVSVVTAETARVEAGERARITDVGRGVTRAVLQYGFMEEPDVPLGLVQGAAAALGIGDEATYFVAAEDLKVTKAPGMALWREHLFSLVHRNATSAADWLCLPPDRVVIVGVPVEL